MTVRILHKVPLYGTSTNVGRISSFPGIYGKKVGSVPANSINVRVRGSRAPLGRNRGNAKSQ